jgi:hypothetical protein
MPSYSSFRRGTAATAYPTDLPPLPLERFMPLLHTQLARKINMIEENAFTGKTDKPEIKPNRVRVI